MYGWTRFPSVHMYPISIYGYFLCSCNAMRGVHVHFITISHPVNFPKFISRQSVRYDTIQETFHFRIYRVRVNNNYNYNLEDKHVLTGTSLPHILWCALVEKAENVYWAKSHIPLGYLYIIEFQFQQIKERKTFGSHTPIRVFFVCVCFLLFSPSFHG